MPRRRWTGRAGTIASIRLVNFMCHDNLFIELHNRVNFITGQNGSGKSAILAAICVAFGSRARNTQRALTLKDFIRTGCRQARVEVVLQNEGPDAFMPEAYGSRIIIERKIYPTTLSIVLKDKEGKKVSGQMRDLHELTEHFNIDVENPGVIMSQDQSRTFMISTSDSSKFDIFFSATLLRQVSELLEKFQKQMQRCRVYLDHSQKHCQEQEQELGKLDEQVQLIQEATDMAQEHTNMLKMLAWAQVYDQNKTIDSHTKTLEKLQLESTNCEIEMVTKQGLVEDLKLEIASEREKIAVISSRSSGTEETRHSLYSRMTEIGEEKAEIEGKIRAKERVLTQKIESKTRLEHDVVMMQEKQSQENAAAGEALQEQIQHLTGEQQSLQQQFDRLCEEQIVSRNRIEEFGKELERSRGALSHLQSDIQKLRGRSTNKLLAFGGDDVLRLVRSIEESQHLFSKPPIGPIGAHCALSGDKSWALAVEASVGRLFNSFIVNNLQDMRTLRRLAHGCGYRWLQIIIYEFRSMLSIPSPDPRSVLSVLSITSNDPTVFNVLVEHGNAEREILVEDIPAGNRAVFGSQSNVRAAYTKDGTKLFVRAHCQVTLPYERRNWQGARLDVDTHKQELEMEAMIRKRTEEIRDLENRKRMAEEVLVQITNRVATTSARKHEAGRELARKEFLLREWRVQATEAAARPETNELDDEILTLKTEIEALEREMADIRTQFQEVEGRFSCARQEYTRFCDSVKEEATMLENAENKLESLKRNVDEAESAIQKLSKDLDKLFSKIDSEENKLSQSKTRREELVVQACSVCQEEEVAALGGVTATTRALKIRLRTIENNLREYRGHDQNQLLREKMRLAKIVSRAKRLHGELEKKVEALNGAYEKRRERFDSSCHSLCRQLRWTFNSYLQARSFSGSVTADFAAEKLSLMVRSSAARNLETTAALSGGERSFTTLSFVLALNEMADAPFRGMDEFDVFMDAVSRTFCLEMLLEFALKQDCQWIFITPDNISSVPDHPSVKKHLLQPPRVV